MREQGEMSQVTHEAGGEVSKRGRSGREGAGDDATGRVVKGFPTW